MDELKLAAKRLLDAEAALHVMYGSTATHFGGVGGQAMTLHCSVTCHDLMHEKEINEWEDARRDLYRILESL